MLINKIIIFDIKNLFSCYFINIRLIIFDKEFFSLFHHMLQFFWIFLMNFRIFYQPIFNFFQNISFTFYDIIGNIILHIFFILHNSRSNLISLFLLFIVTYLYLVVNLIWKNISIVVRLWTMSFEILIYS